MNLILGFLQQPDEVNTEIKLESQIRKLSLINRK